MLRTKISLVLVDVPNTESQIEGIPVTDENGRYGGANPNDDSGTITYISIRHGGTNIGSGNEINGLTLGGVGSGTIIENVEIVANNDDGIEWFGGTVDITNAVVWNSNDDSMDTDQDWLGTCDNFIILTPNGGSAFELDGPEGAAVNGAANSFTNGFVWAGTGIDHLVDWDGSTNTGISNVYFTGLDASFVIVADDPATADEDESFEPIESFGGNGVGTTSNWEVTLAEGTTLEGVFGAAAAAITSEVAAGANNVGPDASVFAWTWASQAGALTNAGL